MMLTFGHFPPGYQDGGEHQHQHAKEHGDGTHHAFTADRHRLLKNECVKGPRQGQPGRRMSVGGQHEGTI